MIELYLYPIDRDIETIWAESYRDAMDKVRTLMEEKFDRTFEANNWTDFCEELEDSTGTVLGYIVELAQFENESRPRY